MRNEENDGKPTENCGCNRRAKSHVGTESTDPRQRSSADAAAVLEPHWA